MSLKSDLRGPKSAVGAWARRQFPRCNDLYPQLRDASTPHVVIPDGWGDGRDQRWSWSGTATDTMLRWQLGCTDEDSPTVGGATIVLARPHAPALEGALDRLRGTDLGELVATNPDLDDLEHAAKVAVLWALAEQHARYGGTVNPLSGFGMESRQALLDGVVPSDVCADVQAIAAGPARVLVEEILTWGQLTFGPAYRYPGGADADLLAGTTIVEIKTTIAKPKMIDVLQAICYGLLSDAGVESLA